MTTGIWILLTAILSPIIVFYIYRRCKKEEQKHEHNWEIVASSPMELTEGGSSFWGKEFCKPPTKRIVFVALEKCECGEERAYYEDADKRESMPVGYAKMKLKYDDDNDNDGGGSREPNEPPTVPRMKPSFPTPQKN